MYSKAVFELTSIGEVDRIRVEECALKFFTELVVIVVLENCFGNVLGIGVEELVGGERVTFSGELSAFDLLLSEVNDLL